MRVTTRKRVSGASVTGQSLDRSPLRCSSLVGINTKRQQSPPPVLGLAPPPTVTLRRPYPNDCGTLAPQPSGVRPVWARDRPMTSGNRALEDSRWDSKLPTKPTSPIHFRRSAQQRDCTDKMVAVIGSVVLRSAKTNRNQESGTALGYCDRNHTDLQDADVENRAPKIRACPSLPNRRGVLGRSWNGLTFEFERCDTLVCPNEASKPVRHNVVQQKPNLPLCRYIPFPYMAAIHSGFFNRRIVEFVCDR